MSRVCWGSVIRVGGCKCCFPMPRWDSAQGLGGQGGQLGHPAPSRVPCPLCRPQPTPGARRGAKVATFASPAASTSVKWRPSWWASGAASAWRTCPTSEPPTAHCPPTPGPPQARRCPCPYDGPAQHRSPSVPSWRYPWGGTPTQPHATTQGDETVPCVPIPGGPHAPAVLTLRLGAMVRAWGVWMGVPWGPDPHPVGFTS